MDSALAEAYFLETGDGIEAATAKCSHVEVLRAGEASSDDLSETCNTNDAVIDSGASDHMSGCAGDFVSISSQHTVEIFVADRVLQTPGRRAIFRDDELRLKTGIYHRSFRRRLISVGRLDQAGGGF